MVKEKFLQYLEKPTGILNEQTQKLKTIIEQYPYFQSAQALYLKTLKDQQSFKYNNQLKITASHTIDRTILFNFITSEEFNESCEETIETSTDNLREQKEIKERTNIEEAIEISEKEVALAIENTITKEELGIGKPLIFDKNEAYSFQKWLTLASSKPIIRTKEQPKKTNKKLDIIDRFILNSPKLSRLDKTASTEVKVIEKDDSPQLMTETLAKVYLEQKKYENAIKAYEILSLKYPEKSGYFADQIKRIRILQKK